MLFALDKFYLVWNKIVSRNIKPKPIYCQIRNTVILKVKTTSGREADNFNYITVYSF